MLRIESVPIMASSNRTVSVPWFGNKFKIFEFFIFVILFPKKSCKPFSGEPKTTSNGLGSLEIHSMFDFFMEWPLREVSIMLPFQEDIVERRLPLSITL